MYHDDDFEPRPYGRRRVRAKARREVGAGPADDTQPFAESVQVTKAERAWIQEHLGPFRESCLVEDVALRIKAGKEATVYACTGHPSTGQGVIAAKLYRKRSLRGEQNAGRYAQGRSVLDMEGRAASSRAWRLSKAIAQKSTKGLGAMQTSWLMHEFALLSELYSRGGNVPRPLAHGEYALLMEFIGDGIDPAPSLNEVTLEPRQARRLFEQIMFDIEMLLELGWVHGDLSPYNILYQPDRAVLIDFPQIVACRGNPDARTLFDRDVARVAQYFSRTGLTVEPRELAGALWDKHVAPIAYSGG